MTQTTHKLRLRNTSSVNKWFLFKKLYKVCKQHIATVVHTVCRIFVNCFSRQVLFWGILKKSTLNHITATGKSVRCYGFLVTFYQPWMTHTTHKLQPRDTSSVSKWFLFKKLYKVGKQHIAKVVHTVCRIFVNCFSRQVLFRGILLFFPCTHVS